MIYAHKIPWQFVPRKDSDVGGFREVCGDPNEWVCHFGEAEQYYPVEGTAPTASDARLMEAAPELFNRCSDFLDLIKQLKGTEIECALAMRFVNAYNDTRVLLDRIEGTKRAVPAEKASLDQGND